MRMENRWALLFILIFTMATMDTAICDNFNPEGPRCPRSAEKVLARFSKDRMLHVRNRRGTAEETSQEFLEAIAAIEGDQRSLIADDLTRKERRNLEGTLADRLQKFCDLVGYQDALTDEKKEAYCGKYRAINGVCNNKEHPNWGRAGYAYQRLLRARYKDEISEPKREEPSAREVSRVFTLNGEVETSTHGASELVMHFGQFLDHDLNLTPAANTPCECGDKNDLCYPIECTEDDPMCGNATCIPFRRSRPTINGDCTKGPRTHENTITSFVDASNVYGSSHEEFEELHDHTKGLGLMLVEVQPIDEGHIHLLPPDRENEECVTLGDRSHCGRGGDVRAAEQPGLTSLHTMFVREHNRIATMLHALNEDWDSERLYEESRRIVIAVWQKIVYGEWLPVVLGTKTMNKYKLGLWSQYEGYDKEMNPTLYNEFAAAFMRFGHSFIPEKLKRVTSLHEHDQFPSIELRSAFFNAAHMYETEYGSISSLLLGMISTDLLPVDRHFSDAISKHLFEDPETRKDGLDLIALNIQRGRDHGLPPYIAYRRKCGLTVPGRWRDLKGIMDDDTRNTLKKIYGGVRKIDAFVGYIAEKPMEGALVGETAACVLGQQFKNLKYGDRYWFENTEGDQAFTAAQLAAIKDVTLARLICNNIRVKSVQPAVFKVPDEKADNGDRAFYRLLLEERYPDRDGKLNGFNNHRVDCSNSDLIPELSLGAWRED